MRNLLRFLITYHLVLLFVILQSIGITMLIKNNDYHNIRYNNLAQRIQQSINEKKELFTSYLSLKEINRELAKENARLRNIVESSRYMKQLAFQKFTKADTFYNQQFTYVSASVVNNSVNKQYNYITIDKGYKAGIKNGMSVICEKGIVGIIVDVSSNYSLAISVLNKNLKISAKIKKNNYFGSFEWSGKNSTLGVLNEIPIHVDVAKGDSIITSGFSGIFPEGVMIGTVREVEMKGGNFYKIEIDMSSEIQNIKQVFIVNNLNKSETEKLETSIKE